MRILFSLIFLGLLAFVSTAVAQNDEVSSRNGVSLPVHGTIRVLMVFVEIQYPDGKDKFAAEAGDLWRPGSLPVWADDLFDPAISDNPEGQATRFYYESSFGDYHVLGDYLINPENPGAPFVVKSDGSVNANQLLTEIWNKGFLSKSALPPDSFDLCRKTSSGVMKAKPEKGDELYYDHIMFIVRNCTYPGNLAGYASAGNLAAKGPMKTDSYSVFATRNANPLQIMMHEFNHLLFGGNNVHCCGGNHAASGAQLFLSFQGGWGMMGAANKSLLTCNGWDRYKLGWKMQNKQYYISAVDSSGKEMQTDFDFGNTAVVDTLVVLRDFVSTGDVIRFKIPGIPENEYQQWLWIENHQTQSFNNSPFDVFQYEASGCAGKALPGLYAYIQVEHNATEGPDAFKGPADFIRVLPASGMYDFMWGDTMVRNNWCVGNGLFYPFERLYKYRNPLSGNSVSEMPAYDSNGDGHLDEKEKRDPAIEKVNGEYRNNLPYLGEEGFAFRLNGNRKIGLATNPSTANSLTLLNDNKAVNKALPPDNRTIYLNSISAEIIRENFPNAGSILVRVRNGDNTITENVRWCAPHIILPDLPGELDLVLMQNKKMVIDGGLTPTQIDSAINVKGTQVLTAFTTFEMMPGTTFLMKKRSILEIRNGSVFIVPEGATIVLEKGAKMNADKSSKLIIKGKIIKR